MIAAPVRPAAGQLVGRFRLKSELGRGAQATVWRAHDERLDRDVAIKLLDPGAGSVAVNQWLHEARAVSRLAHPHIVPLFEADEAQGQPYLVFELVTGRTLAEALRADGAMPARDAVSMMLCVLDALRLAHKHGIVHRDLKPTNILIDADGRARVMDFGIAARLADRATALIVGTPGYMVGPAKSASRPPRDQS
jgi:serine/threonine protein kinase